MSEFLPAWIPNIHPLIIHFPIALLIMAVAFQFISLVINQPKWFEYSLLVMVAGIVSLIATFFSGRAAVDTVLPPAEANVILNNHADLALWTLIYFVCLGVLILLVWKLEKAKNKYTAISIVLLGLVGVGMLTKTADYGGRLVYQYGVGVAKTETNVYLKDKSEIDSAVIFLEDGSWTWNADVDYSNSWMKNVKWYKGRENDLLTLVESKSNSSSHLSIKTKSTPVLFAAGEKLDAIQVDILVDLTDFVGTFQVVHHLNDVQNYDYFSITPDMVELGRVMQSEARILSNQEYKTDGPISIRVVGMKRHFRGYINDQLLLHGHTNDLPAGQVGLYIQGTGVIRLISMNVQVLSDNHTG